VLLREELQWMRRLQEASSSQHQQHHGKMAVLAGALITAYMLIALV